MASTNRVTIAGGSQGKGKRGTKATQNVRDEEGQLALEALWGLHQTVGIDDATHRLALEHPNPYVRVWAIRFLGDQRDAGTLGPRLVKLARDEPNVEVRQQLAATARRLHSGGLEILANLLGRKRRRG